MSNEDKNFTEEDFKDFDETSDNIELDSDLSGIDEEAVERALQNVVSQMSDDNETKNMESSDVTQEPDSDSSIFAKSAEIEVLEETNKETEIESQTEEVQNEKIKDINNETLEKPNNKNNKEILNNEEELSQWEEFNSENDVVKKYIVYISKDFVPYIDNLTTDERSAYINDAIQQKLDSQDEKKQALIRKSVIMHFVLAIVIILLLTPIGLLLANKAIMATFDNYKYSQENFEKLYKHRFEHDRAYMRSLQYNQEYEKKLKNSTEK